MKRTEIIKLRDELKSLVMVIINLVVSVNIFVNEEFLKIIISKESENHQLLLDVLTGTLSSTDSTWSAMSIVAQCRCRTVGHS